MTLTFHILDFNACPLCQSHDGEQYPETFELPLPLHGHCRCYYTYENSPPPWPPVITPDDTLTDDFNTYGGDEIAQAGTDALYWLSLIDADSGETYMPNLWPPGIAAPSTEYVINGTYSAHLKKTDTIAHIYSPIADLSADARFGSDDYLVLSAYTITPPNVDGPGVSFLDTSYGQAVYRFIIQAGWNHLKKKRSDTLFDNLDWTKIYWAALTLTSGDQAEAYFDDIRIVKADPDDPTTFNDTGAAWDFFSGVWHVYADVPSATYALGQIEVSADRSAAIRMGDYSAVNYFSAGLRLRAAGAAGLLCFAADQNNAYEIKLDSVAATVSLIRWIDGNPFTLATHAQAIDVGTSYFVGLQRDGANLYAYCKAADQYTAPLFSAANLAASIADVTYSFGRIGFTSYGVNSRFFTLRAGISSAYATLEHSDTTDPLGHIHATGAAFTAPTGTASRAAFDTETVSQVDLARAVKALIDDLQADHLIT